MSLVHILLVGAGGCLGAVSRYIVQAWVQRRFASVFPYGTLLVNVIGSFLLGFMLGIEAPIDWQRLQLLAGTGFLGAFTTYSTFASESLQLVRDGRNWQFLIYQIISYGLGVGGAAAGYVLA